MVVVQAIENCREPTSLLSTTVRFTQKQYEQSHKTQTLQNEHLVHSRRDFAPKHVEKLKMSFLTLTVFLLRH